MEGRLFITGDKHGTFTPFFKLANKTDLSKKDIIIIAGDAGYIWDESYRDNVITLQQLFPGTITFIDGNHENHRLLNQFESTTWRGGRIHRIGERVVHLMRGEIYSIYENNIFVFGGARSVDKDRREENVSWWREEEPSAEEIAYGEEQLALNMSEVDYIITHETPIRARGHIVRAKTMEDDYILPEIFDRWYENIAEEERFKKWYFGHMHVDIEVESRLRGVYNDILIL